MLLSVVSGLLALALALALLLPTLVFALQILLGRRRSATQEGDPATPAPQFAVLMPAHNEADGIAAALGPVLAQLRVGDRVLVIADNCSDDTASVAKACGAEVSIRHNQQLRGKGYALEHGVQQLHQQPPEVVIIVDADCEVEPGALGRLARWAMARQRPVQAAYLMDTASDADFKLRVSQFAWRVKNLVRPRGMHRLGLPCQLSGSGMAFPWAVLIQARLASSHLVEDLQLGLDLALAGKAPVFCEAAQVRSIFATAPAGLVAQRTRWEHGHLESMKAVPALVLRAVARFDARLLAMALDLWVPPLALLLLSTVAAGAMTAAFAMLTGHATPLLVAGAALGLLVIAVGAAWFAVGRDLISPREMATLPLYAVWKIPVYVRYVFDRQVEWVRSQRQ